MNYITSAPAQGTIFYYAIKHGYRCFISILTIKINLLKSLISFNHFCIGTTTNGPG